MKPDPKFLVSLFPPLEIPPEDIDGCPPELGEYRRDFGGRLWSEIEPKIFCYHSDAFCLMEPESLIQFIAGFLHTALNDPNSTAAEYLVYFAGSNRFVRFAKLLTTDQLSFIIDTIDHLLLSDDYYSISDAVQYDKIRSQVLLKN